jgi:hypothetical protein
MDVPDDAADFGRLSTERGRTPQPWHADPSRMLCSPAATLNRRLSAMCGWADTSSTSVVGIAGARSRDSAPVRDGGPADCRQMASRRRRPVPQVEDLQRK